MEPASKPVTLSFASITVIFITVGRSRSNSKRVELAHVNIVVDPMPMDYNGVNDKHIYSCSVNGTTLTITRTDKEHAGWDWTFKTRACNSTEEVIPDFTSTNLHLLRS